MKIVMKNGLTTINGRTYTSTDGAFDCDDMIGERLVKLGVAIKAGATKEPEKPVDDKPPVDTGTLDSLSWDELRAKAKEAGIDLKGKKKAEVLEALEKLNEQEADEPEEDAPTFDAEGAIQ